MKKQAFSHLTEVELIDRWKDTNNVHYRTRAEIETYFYKKYYPLCYSMSYKYKSISSVEDNMQECYLIMLKALEWIDTNKISNIEVFSFGFIFKKYISAHFNIEKYESYKTIKDKESISLNNEDIHQTAYIKSFEDKSVFHYTLSKFKNTLKENEILLWEYLEEGKKQKDIAKKLNKTNINYQVQKLKTKYIHYMNNNGYRIEV